MKLIVCNKCLAQKLNSEIYRYNNRDLYDSYVFKL